MDQPTFADIAPEAQAVPVSAPAERHREEYRAALCEVADYAGALWRAVEIAPHDDATLSRLDEGYRLAAAKAMFAYLKFTTARDCAGSA